MSLEWYKESQENLRINLEAMEKLKDASSAFFLQIKLSLEAQESQAVETKYGVITEK